MRNPAIPALLCCLALPLPAADWLHYRGPNLNGTIAESGWSGGWKGAAPTLLWKAEVGIGAASFAIRGDRVFTMGNQDGQDVVVCLDAASGRVVWKHAYPCRFEERMFEGGTAATPTVDGERVFVLSYDGQFRCLNAATGALVWQQHLVKDHGGRLSQWKYASSPTVAGDLVIVDGGGNGTSTVALDKATGRRVWASGKDGAGYATVIPFRQAGRDALLVFKAEAMVAKSLRDGAELWRIPWKSPYDVNASSPFVTGDRLFISSGYPAGRAALFRIGGAQPVKLWQNDELKTKMSSAALHRDHAYGVTEKGGRVLCLSLADGLVKWRGDAGGSFGNLIVVNDTLVVLGDDGELVLAPADPAGFKPSQRARILTGRCWVQPAFANGFLLAKNNKGATVCVDLRK